MRRTRRQAAKYTRPTTMWAAISEDEPPKIYGVAFYRDGLQSNLRHVRVSVTLAKKRRGRRP